MSMEIDLAMMLHINLLGNTLSIQEGEGNNFLHSLGSKYVKAFVYIYLVNIISGFLDLN